MNDGPDVIFIFYVAWGKVKRWASVYQLAYWDSSFRWLFRGFSACYWLGPAWFEGLLLISVLKFFHIISLNFHINTGLICVSQFQMRMVSSLISQVTCLRNSKARPTHTLIYHSGYIFFPVFLLQWNMYNKVHLLAHFKCTAEGIKCIHDVAQPYIPRALFRIETLYPLNTFPFLPPSTCWQLPFCFVSADLTAHRAGNQHSSLCIWLILLNVKFTGSKVYPHCRLCQNFFSF